MDGKRRTPALQAVAAGEERRILPAGNNLLSITVFGCEHVETPRKILTLSESCEELRNGRYRTSPGRD
jgi:hypothetical protein